MEWEVHEAPSKSDLNGRSSLYSKEETKTSPPTEMRYLPPPRLCFLPVSVSWLVGFSAGLHKKLISSFPQNLDGGLFVLISQGFMHEPRRKKICSGRDP